MESSSSAFLNYILVSSQIFNNIFVGIGAFLAGLAGLKVIGDWYKEKKIVSQIENYRKMYPLSESGKKFQLIASTENTGKIYLLDKVTNMKRHIASLTTLHDLGFDSSDRQLMSKDVFDKIQTGDIILTSGKIGS